MKSRTEARGRRQGQPVALADLLRGMSLREPPAGVMRQALALGSQLRPRTGRLAQAVSHVLEVLFDSGLQPAPAGVRKGVPSAERRVLVAIRGEGSDAASSPQVDVRVRCEPAGDLVVAGQVLPPSAIVSAHLVLGRTRVPLALGAHGEFVARGAPAGRRTPHLALVLEGGVRVSIPVPLPGAVALVPRAKTAKRRGTRATRPARRRG